MYPFNVSSGNSQVISTGTIIQFNRQPIEFKIDFPGFPLKLIMNFENTTDPQTKMEAQTVDVNTISLTFYNYNNPLGTGTVKALKIADYKGQHVYLNYKIYALTDQGEKTVQYTFYISEDLI